MNVGIIGGGPAGMFAALEAVKKGNQVTIIDNNPSLGRKLSVTGGGRGNLTNLGIRASAYYSQDRQVLRQLEPLFSVYTAQFLINYFYQLGIPTYHTDDGWVYPISNSAKNLSQYLISLLEENNIKILTETFIEDVIPSASPRQMTLIDAKQNKYGFEHVIFAAGGKAYPQVGSSSSILHALSKNGYQTNPIYPALAPLKTTKTTTGLLKGLRFDAQLTLKSTEGMIAAADGNIIFTEWGLNGPGVMNLSHFYYLQPEQLILTINPLIQFKPEMAALIKNHPNQNLKLSVLLLSFIPAGVISQYEKNKNRFLHKTLDQLARVNLDHLLQSFDLEETVLGTRDFKFSQLSTGGIKLNQIDLTTMKSKIHPNLSFAGEILDLIGPCGGFNLHWAFMSGLIAGLHI